MKSMGVQNVGANNAAVEANAVANNAEARTNNLGAQVAQVNNVVVPQRRALTATPSIYPGERAQYENNPRGMEIDHALSQKLQGFLNYADGLSADEKRLVDQLYATRAARYAALRQHMSNSDSDQVKGGNN